MTQKERFAQWCRDNTMLLNDFNAVKGIQSQTPGLEVKKVSSGALLIRFSPKDEWMDMESWYNNYVSNCSSRLREEVARLRNVCSPEQYASVLAMSRLLDNSELCYVNGYDSSNTFLNSVKEFVGDGVFKQESNAAKWGQFLQQLEQSALGCCHDAKTYEDLLRRS